MSIYIYRTKQTAPRTPVSLKDMYKASVTFLRLHQSRCRMVPWPCAGWPTRRLVDRTSPGSLLLEKASLAW